MNLTEPWAEAAKRDEYRRATWREWALAEVRRYDDDPRTVLDCRRPPLGTPEEQGHRDAEDAYPHGTEQGRARDALTTARVPHRDMGYGFHVRGRVGHWMAPAEILTAAERGRLR